MGQLFELVAQPAAIAGFGLLLQMEVQTQCCSALKRGRCAIHFGGATRQLRSVAAVPSTSVVKHGSYVQPSGCTDNEGPLGSVASYFG